jgi:hypothetical protein
MKNIFYVGMDVHKDSVRVAVLKCTGKDTVYEAARDLLRCREDIRLQAHRIKQQLAKFLLRNGHIYEAKRQLWTKAHRDWMVEIAEIAESAAYQEPVARLRCFKGIDYITALALVCEVGDYRRFGSAARRDHEDGEYAPAAPAGRIELALPPPGHPEHRAAGKADGHGGTGHCLCRQGAVPAPG